MTRNGQNLTKLIAIIALCFSTITNVFASEVKLRPENFTHLTIEDGLPQNNVRCIEEDQYGFLWLCTSDGLVRYDGYEFELVTEGVDGSRISNTKLRAILADKNVLWIATNNGLNRFDLEKGIFELIDLGLENNSKSVVKSLIKVRDEIWVGTNDGLIILSKTNEIISVLNNQSIIVRDMMLYNDIVLVSDYGKGMIRIDSVSKKILDHKTLEGKSSNNILNFSYINNNIYASTYGNGLFILDSDLNILKHKQLCKTTEHDCLASNYVFFTKRYNNNIWIGTRSGFNLLSLESAIIQKTILLTSLIHNKYISNSIVATHFSEKYLWFGLKPGGLVKYQDGLNGVNFYRPFQNEIMNSSSVKSVFAISSSKNSTYVGTYSGLYEISNNSNELIELDSVNKELTESGRRISSLCLFEEKYLFLGTADGLFLFNVENKLFEKLKLPDDMTQITAISCNKNKILIGAHKGRLYQFYMTNKKFERYEIKKDLADIHSILNEDEKLFLSTRTGLEIFDIKNNKLTSIGSYLPNKMITKTANTNSMYLIGTSGDGLYVWNKLTKTMKKVPLVYQVIGNNIYGLEVVNNDAWITTNNGIIQLNLDSFKYNHYIQSHGLGDKEFNLGSLFYNKYKNMLFAGGVTALTSINLDIFKNMKWDSGNIISNVSSVNSDGIVLKNYYNSPELIEVNEGDTIKFKLGNLNSITRYKTDFQYTLKSGSTSIVTSLRPKQRQITLVDISRNSFNILIGKENIEVLVIPHIWKRWWSYILYFIISFCLFKLLLNHLKVLQNTRNREFIANKELELKRNQLASFSHELRTPLNSIIGIVDSFKTQEPELVHLKSSSYLLRLLIDNALDSISLEVGNSLNVTELPFNIEKMIYEVADILNLYISASKINIDINIDSSVPTFIVADRLKVQQVVINLVKNAIKHSETATKINIKLDAKENILSISVADNGIGIEYSEQNTVFEVFKKTDKKNTGFGLGLYISKLIGKNLGGDLLLDSEPGRGSNFTLKFPFKNKTDNKLELSISSDNKQLKVDNLLILEDDPLNIYALELQLKNLEFTNYKIVENFELFQQEEPSDYDCIILDLNFGHEIFNGVDLAKQLHNDSYNGSIYILSAEADEKIRSNAQEFVDDYIVKPVVTKELKNILFN